MRSRPKRDAASRMERSTLAGTAYLAYSRRAPVISSGSAPAAQAFQMESGVMR
ncbi:MAG TPA: hypothetical protein VFZ20_14235 [Longimicrobium sp.]|nr:hypothetical protein [Longimicrobium sp.]